MFWSVQSHKLWNMSKCKHFRAFFTFFFRLIISFWFYKHFEATYWIKNKIYCNLHFNEKIDTLCNLFNSLIYQTYSHSFFRIKWLILSTIVNQLWSSNNNHSYTQWGSSIWVLHKFENSLSFENYENYKTGGCRFYAICYFHTTFHVQF